MAKEKINFEDEQVRLRYRHTTSHILAQAVKKLWPDAKLAIGPAIENGFYYDFDMEHKLNDQDLLKIQKEMKKIIQANYPLERFELPREEAIKFMADKGEDYKVELISKYVRWELLGYKKGQRLREEDKKAHEMHMGFSAEESRRCKESPNPMFVNKFPLVEMGLTRADNFAYIKDVWGLETKASACSFCPFHKNYFFKFLRENEPEQYAQVVGVDELLRDKNPKPPMDSDLFISRSRKRLMDLTDEDCNDAECFEYCGMQIWNGF